jgi:TonB family protein
MLVPTGSGYELRLADNTRGEVINETSRLTIADLLSHNLLPRRQGSPVLSISPGNSGHLFLDNVRIDFSFSDGTPVQAIQFEGFSVARAFAKSLTEDPFFKMLVAILLIMQMGLLQWASQVKIKPPDETNQAKLLQKVQKIVTTFKPIEEVRPKSELASSPKTNTESKSKEEENNKNEKPEVAEKTPPPKKGGYGSEAEGEGVDMEKVGVLALIGGTGASDTGSDLMRSLIKEDLAKGLDQVISTGKNLSAGRNQSANSTTDVNVLLAYGILGDGKGGNSSIDDLLKGDIANSPAVKLEKTGKVSVDNLGNVSGSEEAVGARSEESLRKVLSQNMGRLQYIYNKYLKTYSDIGGKVEVEITISADGTVATATILSSEIAIAEFQREIIAAMRRWKYEVITQGQVKVVYPILFVKIS